MVQAVRNARGLRYLDRCSHPPSLFCRAAPAGIFGLPAAWPPIGEAPRATIPPRTASGEGLDGAAAVAHETDIWLRWVPCWIWLSEMAARTRLGMRVGWVSRRRLGEGRSPPGSSGAAASAVGAVYLLTSDRGNRHTECLVDCLLSVGTLRCVPCCPVVPIAFSFLRFLFCVRCRFLSFATIRRHMCYQSDRTQAGVNS